MDGGSQGRNESMMGSGTGIGFNFACRGEFKGGVLRCDVGGLLNMKSSLKEEIKVLV